MTLGSVSARAHAKVNLSLRITSTRADGYHDLHTVFQALALHDTVTATSRPGPFAVTCDTPGVPLDDSNLAWRAADALWMRLGRPGPVEGVCLDIRKRIPMQAGLGGGSADGAAALRALARLWDAGVAAAELLEVAAGLGADVAFFLVGGTAVGSGRGEILRPLDGVPSRDVVLVLPAFGVSTREAYRWYDEDVAARLLRHSQPTWPEVLASDTVGATQASPPGAGIWCRSVRVAWPPPPGALVNDLQPAVARRHAEIGDIEALLLGAGAETAAMSGSGSAVFGLFPNLAGARDAARAARARGWRVVRSRTLGGPEYARRARPLVTARRS